MFRGINGINIDPKSRIAMPTRYREALQQDCGGHVIMTIDTEARCLLLYPLPAWQEIEAKLAVLPSFNVQARRIQRLLIGHATDVEMDKQGRLLLPPVLRQYAQLDKRIMLVGQGKKFEIWDEELWQSSRDDWLAESSNPIESELPDEVQSLSL